MLHGRLRISTPFKKENGVLVPMPHLACWGLGANLGQGQQQMPHSPRPTHPWGPKSHWAGMPAAQRRQKNTKMPVVTKNSQPQGPSGKEVLASATNCKNQPGALVGMPWQGFGRRGQCSKSGGLPGGCHLDLCIFGGWAAFHGNFLLWAASMPPCQCACPQSWVRPKVCSLGW